MRCNICDKALSEKEGSFNRDIQTFDPCTVCLDIAMDAAYTGGWTDEDDDKYVLLDDDPFDYYSAFDDISWLTGRSGQAKLEY